MNNITIDIDALTAALSRALPVAIKAAVNASVVPSELEKTPKTKRGRPKKANNGICPKCSESYMYCACADNPLNKKEKLPKTIKRVRGRKLIEVPLGDTEIIDVSESDLEVLAEVENPTQHKPLPAHIVAAKRIVNVGIDTMQNTIEVRKKPGEIKFMDIKTVGDRIPSEKYPEPSERRTPAKQMNFTCSRCDKKFQAYPTELPQSLIKEKVPTGGFDSPRIYCNDCAGIGK